MIEISPTLLACLRELNLGSPDIVQCTTRNFSKVNFLVTLQAGKRLLPNSHCNSFIRHIGSDWRNFLCSQWTKCFGLSPKDITRTIFLIQPVPDLPRFIYTNLTHPDNLTVVKPCWQVDGSNILQPRGTGRRSIQHQVYIRNCDLSR